MAKYLGQTGLVYLWGKIKTWVGNYVKITSSTGKDTITAGNSSVDIYDWAQASTKPTYTANEVGALSSTTSIPSKTSDLTNDSGFITGYTETDPTVPAWAKASSKPSYTASEVGAVATSVVGAANGVCPLDANTKIDAQYLPSYVDDVVEAYIRSGQTALSQNWLATGSASGTVITPQSGVIYVIMNGTDDYPTNSQYRWATNTYVKLNDGGVSELTTSEMDTATNNWA